MAWNDYISGFGFDTPNYSTITFTSYTKEEIAETVADISYSTSWTGKNDDPGGIYSFSSTDTKHVVPYHIVFDDNGEIATYGFDVSCSATIYAHTKKWKDYNFSAQYMPLNCKSGNAQDIYSMLNTKNCVISVNVPVIAVRQSTFTSMQTYISQHRSAWTSGQEEYWEYYNSIIKTGNAQWLNVNTELPTEPEGTEYTIYNTGQRGTWSVGDVVSDVSTPFYRWARVKLASTGNVDGRLAFYREGLDDGIIKLKPVLTASVVYCEYSTDGGANWQTSDTFPYQYIYGERINELGTFTYATRSGLSGDSGVPIFEDETTALGWVNHDVNVDITDAINYEDIANRYKYTNKTGDNEAETTMGTASGFRSHFTQKYLLDRGDVSIIANALFDTTTTIFEDIKKGLEMFGERIIDSICSLTYYPIDLTTVFTQLQSQTYIYFGGYQFQPENFSVNKLVGYSGYIDLGSFTIEPTFPNIEDVRNYSPFCRVSIYLPYCGTFELDYNKYVNKTIRVRYYIDVNTGGCLVCLFDSATGGRLLDYMNGQIGSQIPITITDYSGYASAELRNISNLAGVGVNLVGSGIGVHSGVQTVQNATTQRAVEQGGGEIAKGILGVAQAPVDFAKAMYDLSTTSINQFNSTKGSSGALGNQYLPQYVYLIFAYVRTEETPNLLQLEGKPSYKSGTVGSFSGYLEVDSVQLQCSGATENEKRSIINMLNSGIII